MKINDKIKEIETYLSELEDILPLNFIDYKKDLKSKAACERYFEKIIEAIIDLCFLIIKENNYDIPEEDKRTFDILLKEKLITPELTEKLKNAKGMRNILAHEYGNIDDEIIFQTITEDINKDATEFIKIMKRQLK